MKTKLPTAIDLIEAGARCFQGKCLVKIEEQKTQEEMSQRINDVIQEVQDLRRPARLKMVLKFADYHKIEGEALSELITWLCDYQDPISRQ
jgi:ATP/maltotriose-dependent transcriptional regulator MalT